MKKLSISVCTIALLFAVACNKNDKTTNNVSSKEVYLDLSDTAGNYYNGQFATDIDKKITLGRVLFYDTRLSLNNAVSCASCHKQQYAFADDIALSRGFEGRMTGRNSIAIQNLLPNNSFVPTTQMNFFTGSLFWDSRENNLKDMVLRPIANHVEMGIEDISTLPAKLSSIEHYNWLLAQAYPFDNEMTVEMIAESMSWFLISIKSDSSRFDLYNRTKQGFTGLELTGMNLFITKYDCAGCHVPFMPYNGNAGGSNIGLDATPKDKGMAAVGTGQEGAFRIPNLKNVAVTAPYMHDGRFKDLNEVLEHYSRGIMPAANLDDRLKDADKKPIRMNISENEKMAIIAFLNTMTDYSLLTKPQYSNPFRTR